jgi:hypothetical protein
MELDFQAVQVVVVHTILPHAMVVQELLIKVMQVVMQK